MELHDFLDDDLRNEAALFVLNSLGAEEARTYRLHLGQCDVCRVEVESLAQTAGKLALIAPSVTPPGGLWDRVLARVRRTDPRLSADARPANRQDENSPQVWKRWEPDTGRAVPDFTFLSGVDDSGFEPTPIAGIEARKLFVDHENDRVTMLVRMRAGSSYPPHIHGAVEECYVISGDLSVGTHRMRAGDYQRAEAGSTHERQSTEGGCVVLLVSSLHDELI
ncbi:MAG: cupin domain-containing protein [Planctomycetes bacterium]|nr:cupin domain-containing protein [Planctomycetota bacterium]